MSRAISEPDWKLFRQLQPLALERFCQRVLEEVGRLAADTGKTSHERYLAVLKLIEVGRDLACGGHASINLQLAPLREGKRLGTFRS